MGVASTVGVGVVVAAAAAAVVVIGGGDAVGCDAGGDDDDDDDDAEGDDADDAERRAISDRRSRRPDGPWNGVRHAGACLSRGWWGNEVRSKGVHGGPRGSTGRAKRVRAGSPSPDSQKMVSFCFRFFFV